MKYVIIEKFIDEEFSKNLINDANKIIDFNKELIIHNNRAFVSSTSISFNKLIEKSDVWKNLEKKINSEKFLNFCLEKVNLNKSNYCLKNYFKKKFFSKNEIIYKKISDSKIKSISTPSLIKFIIYRIYKNLLKIIKFSKILYPKKQPLELLFDFSRAGNGYVNNVHRDSDSRLVVFLLYLNNLKKDHNTNGGDLCFHKLANKNEKNLSHPNLQSCEKIESINPEPGKLVIFLNEDDAYHSVSEMKNFKGHRYFLYGGFTLLANRNPFIKNYKSPTEFFLYD